MADKPLILLTNDDGYDAPGLTRLAQNLRRTARVMIVAPDGEQSAISRALSLHRIIRSRHLDDGRIAVAGTPADCINYALFGRGRCRPDLVISGINRGPNLGDDIAYSGTVAGAAEAAAYGFKAFAVSLAVDKKNDFKLAARWAGKIARQLLRRSLPRRCYLNVNVPDNGKPPRGVKITTVGERRYSNSLTRRQDPFGKEYFWLGGGKPQWEPSPEADQDAVAAGFVSITPLSLDLTAHEFRPTLTEWTW